MRKDCGFKINETPIERTLTVAKINIDTKALDALWEEMRESWDKAQEWERTATDEQKKEAYEVWESFGGGH